MDFAKWARENLLFSTITGSRLYGTAREDSDFDTRGVCLDPSVSILGIHRFNQYEHVTKEDDVVIYGATKFLTMCAEANPSILDVLFAPQSAVTFITPEWKDVIAVRNGFLSQKVRRTFSGYAFAQLKRIRRHKAWIDNPPPEPILADYGLFLYSTPNGGQRLEPIPERYNFLLRSPMRAPYLDTQSVKAALRRRSVYRPQDRTAMIAAYRAAEREYKKYTGWRKNRNPARAILEERYGYDVKHAGHLVRLLLQGVNILRTGDYNPVLTGGDRDTVLAVMHGKWEYERLIAFATEYDLVISEMDTPLRKQPDREMIHTLIRGFAAKSLATDKKFMEYMEREVQND